MALIHNRYGFKNSRMDCLWKLQARRLHTYLHHQVVPDDSSPHCVFDLLQ